MSRITKTIFVWSPNHVPRCNHLIYYLGVVGSFSFNCCNVSFSPFLFVASAGAVDEADFENAFFDCPNVKVCETTD